DAFALWNFYKYTYINDGRVVSHDENDVTTSEGQGYAMLRSVWADDPYEFSAVWNWTKKNLQVRDDHLFVWKWKEQVLDNHSATDADTDIALALILASRHFNDDSYLAEAQKILDSIWDKEILSVGERCYVVGGDWAKTEDAPTIHTAYLAPYAYRIFADV